jgi:hypothetical protein
VTDHPFSALSERDKEPSSKRVLDTWIAHAVGSTGIVERRLGWIVASSVAIGALQRAVHTDGQPRFLLKGGTYLEVRLGLRSRATSDIDALFRGDFEEFLATLDSCLEPWGVLQLSRSEVTTIENARRVVKPRRFRLQMSIKGKPWRAVDIEVAPTEGHMDEVVEAVPAPPLSHFGLPSPAELAGIALDYQVAQKLHGGTDPHQPPDAANLRARDLVDLLLLRDAFYRDADDLRGLRAACADLFAARYAEAEQLQVEPRSWPPQVVAYRHWHRDYAGAAGEVGIGFTIDAAAAQVNEWIAEIDAAT